MKGEVLINYSELCILAKHTYMQSNLVHVGINMPQTLLCACTFIKANFMITDVVKQGSAQGVYEWKYEDDPHKNASDLLQMQSQVLITVKRFKLS